MQAFPQKRGGIRYSFNNFSNDMGCGTDLVEGEKVLVIKEIAKVRTNKSIAGKVNRCVMTEIGKSVRILGKNPSKRKPRSDRSGLNLLSMRDMNRLKKRK